MEFSNKIIVAILIVLGCILTINIFIACNNSPVVFENPNDPDSKIYISSDIDSATVDRIDYNTGNVKWYVGDPDDDIENFRIYRYTLTDSTEKQLDITVTVPEKEIQYNTDDSMYVWIDSTMKFNTHYHYKIASMAANIESTKNIEFDYFHGFIEPSDVTVEQTSDTSLYISANAVDPLADSVRIIWYSSGLYRTKVFNDNIIDATIEWNDGTNELDSNSINIEYSYTENDTVNWINVFQSDYTIQFPGVQSFSLVQFNQNTVRLIWQYLYPTSEIKIKADSFVVSCDNNVVGTVITKQKILDQEYFVYYYPLENSQNHSFSVYPMTKFHHGNTFSKDLTYNSALGDEYGNYSFVDTAESSKGIYICNFEVTNEEFCNWARENNFKDTTSIDFKLTDFNSKFEVDPGMENYPVRGIPYYIAKEFAKGNGADVPSVETWMLAASASVSENDFRDYPWGNDPPGDKANYGMKRGKTVLVSQLNGGRVLINSDYNIFGPYNMAGNVMEWVADTVSCFGLLKKTSSATWYNCKGGNWRDDAGYLLIWENYCQPADFSDEVIGIRLIKRSMK